MDKNKVFWISLIVLTVLVFAGSTGAVIMDNHSVKKIEMANGGSTVSEEETDALGDETTPLAEVPKTVNGLLIGFDASLGLTDVMMVAHVDTEKNVIGIVSVPRDLTIQFDDEAFSEIKEKHDISNGNYCKLNEVYGMLGRDEEALQTVKEIISIITGLEMDMMATIDVNGFKDVIDALGGVEFDVPQRMYYSDPVQDLYIDLQPGLQVLDGEDAMGLVRFRHYAMGDLQRISVQQQFLHAAFSQIMAIKDFSTIKNMLMTGYSIFEADFGVVEAMAYAQYFYELGQLEEILSTKHMVTIPSYGQQRNGIWYQLWDLDEANQVVQDLINGVETSGDLSDAISDEVDVPVVDDNSSYDQEVSVPDETVVEESPVEPGEPLVDAPDGDVVDDGTIQEPETPDGDVQPDIEPTPVPTGDEGSDGSTGPDTGSEEPPANDDGTTDGTGSDTTSGGEDESEVVQPADNGVPAN